MEKFVHFECKQKKQFEHFYTYIITYDNFKNQSNIHGIPIYILSNKLNGWIDYTKMTYHNGIYYTTITTSLSDLKDIEFKFVCVFDDNEKIKISDFPENHTVTYKNDKCFIYFTSSEYFIDRYDHYNNCIVSFDRLISFEEWNLLYTNRDNLREIPKHCIFFS